MCYAGSSYGAPTSTFEWNHKYTYFSNNKRQILHDWLICCQAFVKYFTRRKSSKTRSRSVERTVGPYSEVLTPSLAAFLLKPESLDVVFTNQPMLVKTTAWKKPSSIVNSRALFTHYRTRKLDTISNEHGSPFIKRKPLNLDITSSGWPSIHENANLWNAILIITGDESMTHSLMPTSEYQWN